MPRMKSVEAFKRNAQLVEFMKLHKGNENIVSSKEISDFLISKGWDSKPTHVHSYLRACMYEFNAPICYVNTKGYFWAVRSEEISRTIEDMQSRIKSLQQHIDHLNNFVIR